MTSQLRRVAVFCGSSPGHDPAHSEAAYRLGRDLAERGIGLVYGGGGHGLMERVSQGALDGGGEVIGVIPTRMMAKEWGRQDLTELHVVDDMHVRKAMMAEFSDAFIALPGGLGTLEEIIEMWSWRSIEFNDDPVGFLNWGGFWTPLLEALEALTETGFVRREVFDDLVVAETLDEALVGLEARRGATFSDKARAPLR
ncbi:TIGR00730 family Rossman fold protein [Nocardioides yefusunii]|uniref:Cytokinin riboside 5'-monophosphate phosphoribohydrolase n=1 Tax=Nocardioides yefusunii TaxID=2500546 RepID=A0ABW1QVM2_9ACTN|nr:TIGR00730 family Rossman fold protein [Nocardioides yefusunii]